MEKYRIINGKKYFNWSCVRFLLSDLELKAEKMNGTPLYTAASDTSYASSYHINTGRASTDWIKAWASANPNKLIQFVSNNYDGSIQSAVECITTYLQRFCRLTA